MKTEREFLHDISTPVSTMLFLIDSILPPAESEKNANLQKLKKKIIDIQRLVETRRDEMNNSAPS